MENRLVIRFAARVSKGTSDRSYFLYVKGSAMKINHNGNRIDTTVGDLIAAISDVAFEYSADTKEAYHLARLVLVEILKNASLRGEISNRSFSRN